MTIDVFDRTGQQRDLAWLETNYKVKVLDAGKGSKFKLVRVDETEGPAVFIVDVRNEEGKPDVNRPVGNHWPGVEQDDNGKDLRGGGLKSLWKDHAIIQRTSSNGDTGFGFGSGDVMHADGGVHTLWVLSPSLPSDALSGVGWLGGTDHRGPNRLTFQIVQSDEGGNEGDGGNGGNGGGEDVMAELRALHADLRKVMKHLGVS
jgi:hypothetical protein